MGIRSRSPLEELPRPADFRYQTCGRLNTKISDELSQGGRRTRKPVRCNSARRQCSAAALGGGSNARTKARRHQAVRASLFNAAPLAPAATAPSTPQTLRMSSPTHPAVRRRIRPHPARRSHSSIAADGHTANNPAKVGLFHFHSCHHGPAGCFRSQCAVAAPDRSNERDPGSMERLGSNEKAGYRAAIDRMKRSSPWCSWRELSMDPIARVAGTPGSIRRRISCDRHRMVPLATTVLGSARKKQAQPA